MKQAITQHPQRKQAIYLGNLILFAVLFMGLMLFDYSLQLGQFHGMVTYILTIYLSAILILLNGIIGGVLWYFQRRELAGAFFMNMLITLVLAIICDGIIYGVIAW